MYLNPSTLYKFVINQKQAHVDIGKFKSTKSRKRAKTLFKHWIRRRVIQELSACMKTSVAFRISQSRHVQPAPEGIEMDIFVNTTRFMIVIYNKKVY